VRFPLYECEFDGWNGMFTIQRLGLLDCSFLSLLVMVAVAVFFSYSVAPTLFVLFASVFALLSARYRYHSVRSSVFQSDSSAVLFSRSCVLLRSVYCAERVGLSSSSTYTDFFPFLPSVLSFYPPATSQIAELLHIVHRCLVPRCNMCIS